MKKFRGFALITALPIVVALSALATLIIFYTVKSQRLIALNSQHTSLVSRGINSIFNLKVNQSTPFLTTSPKRYEIIDPIYRALDSFGTSLTGEFPYFDMDEIFSRSPPCYLFQSARSMTTLGTLLSQQSFVAETTCVSLTQNSASLTSNGNLALLNYAATPSDRTVAALGYLDIKDATIANDLTIYSGGDLHLGSVRATMPAHLILVSSTGRISINQIVGDNIVIHPLARVDVSLPSSARIAEPVLNTLPILKEQVLGISADPL